MELGIWTPTLESPVDDWPEDALTSSIPDITAETSVVPFSYLATARKGTTSLFAPAVMPPGSGSSAPRLS